MSTSERKVLWLCEVCKTADACMGAEKCLGNKVPTPMTDAKTFEIGSPKAGHLGFSYVVVDAIFARQLETDRARLVEALRESVLILEARREKGEHDFMQESQRALLRELGEL